MKLLVAIDSFKGCATSSELNNALLESINHPLITEKVSVPIADGGEGTLDALYSSLSGEYCYVSIPDLQGKIIDARYLVIERDGQRVAFVESAEVVGIDRIIPSIETIKSTNSYGLGLLVSDIIASGITEIYMTLGGSGTSDGGLGFLAGLGARQIETKGINPLLVTSTIDLSVAVEKLNGVKLTALADVTNPYTGPKGFSQFFGKQKGGTKQLLLETDEKAKEIVRQLNKYVGFDINASQGSGAAGGLGGAILAIGGSIQPGFDTISEFLSLKEQITTADLVITGEGKLDEQTENGKVPYGVAMLCQQLKVPVFAVCGIRTNSIGRLSDLLLGAFSIQLGPVSLEEAMDRDNTLRNLQIMGQQLVNVFLAGKNYSCNTNKHC